jgi:FkbM family methyltransferase
MQFMSVANRFVMPGANVWDVGGNVGVFAIAAAHRAGSGSEVLAVEPDPFLAYLIQCSVLHRDNQDLHISVLCEAISNTSELSCFLIAARGRSRNSLEQSQRGAQGDEVRFVQYVPTTTLDSLLAYFRTPGFIKVDVEDAEALVLGGVEEVLSKCRPNIYIEVGDEQRDRVTDVLKRHRYRLFDRDTTDGCEMDKCPWNTLAVPAESTLTNRGYNPVKQ